MALMAEISTKWAHDHFGTGVDEFCASLDYKMVGVIFRLHGRRI